MSVQDLGASSVSDDLFFYTIKLNSNPHAVIPAQAGIQKFGFRKCSEVARNAKLLDSRLRGNDGMSGFYFKPIYCAV